MPTAEKNRAFRLSKRPTGLTEEPGLELVTTEVPVLEDGQALVRTLVLSVDPSSRIFMSDIRSALPPVQEGAVMRGLGIGRVVASRRTDLPVGALVVLSTEVGDSDH
ncbi:hypothetical protein ACIP69_40025 [Streptomyces hygroscopicus]|uniref:hypothetical protein n=1 Tax=Streptomyces hygroscopicus TaxID=1912 RepID=UPI003819ADFF